MFDLKFYKKLYRYIENNIEHLSPTFIDYHNVKSLTNLKDIDDIIDEPNNDFIRYFYTYLLYFHIPLPSIKYVNNIIYNSKNVRV